MTWIHLVNIVDLKMNMIERFSNDRSQRKRKKHFFSFWVLLLFLFSSNISGMDLYFCDHNWEDLPVRQNGRVKPLLVHAQESVKYLTGEKQVGNFSAIKAYCLLSLRGMGLNTQVDFFMPVEHEEVRRLLKLSKRDKSISYDEASSHAALLRKEMVKAVKGGGLESALKKHLGQLGLYRDIAQGTNWMFADSLGERIVWMPLPTFITEEKIKQTNQTGVDAFKTVIMQSKDNYIRVLGDDYLLELSFFKANLTWWAMFSALLALICFFIFKGPKPAIGFVFVTMVLQLTIIILRIIISGRAPITNMYETVLFSGFGGLILSLIVGFIKKEKIFIIAGLSYNICTLLMLNFANNMLSSHISPLVPVLRDNFWLSTHVTMVILSYAALAISWMLANIALARQRFFGFDAKEQNAYRDRIYTCIKIGVVLLAGGVILGGVWADYSWGRFWGWDPKETWSLIALCTYMVILHGKATSWIPPQRFIPLVALAFMSVLMAWFGVNYVLATGLHSYGFSQGGALFLASVIAGQFVFLSVVLWPSKKRVIS